jgi:drug/metabolite transporter (DMT)-like permease
MGASLDARGPHGDRPDVSRRTLAIVFALLALYVIWGSTYYAMRVALEGLPPFLMAGPRFALAGVAMALALRARGAPWPTRSEWIASTKVGFLLLVCGNGAVAIAERSIDSGVAAVVVGSMPIWAAVFAPAFGIATTGREWGGLVLGFAGLVLLNVGGALVIDAHGIVLLVAPIAWAIGSLWSKRLPLPAGAMATAAQMIAGGVTMIGLAIATGERVHGVPSLRVIAALLYLAVFGSIVAFTAYNWLLRNVRPALATSYAYVNPIVALAIGAGLGHEVVRPHTIAAAALCLLGVFVISRSKA